MPFDKFFPRSFTVSSIVEYAPTLSGIYGISNAREWIYIGETDNIRAALLDHLQVPGTSLSNKRPTGFVFEVCDHAARPRRQDRLVFEYEPTCNRNGTR